MPDISMCVNKDCQVKLDCYRYIATPHEYWQSYSCFNETLKEDCEHFVKAHDYEKEEFEERQKNAVK